MSNPGQMHTLYWITLFRTMSWLTEFVIVSQSMLMNEYRITLTWKHATQMGIGYNFVGNDFAKHI